MFVTKIKLTLIMALGLIPALLMAQNTANIGIGAEIGLPSGNFAGVSAVGLGASLKADLPVANNLSLSLSGGYMNFFGRRNQILQVQDLSYAPAKAGLKYWLSEGFYAEGQLGAALPLSSGLKTLLAWSPGIGTQFKLSGENKLDLGIRYEGWSGKRDSNLINTSSVNTKGFAGLRFAYVFGL